MAQISPVAASIAVLHLPGPQKTKQQNLVIKSAQQASSRAQSQYGGKVLRVQSSQVNGNPGYRVKLLSNDGVVFYASVNAVTGAVSRN
ncbi:PepSY domain-containing protein [Shewanella sp. SP1S2-7]|uniref:PepSY domain-containing protein n=2 Tax=Shewanella holmiensis TaxID=2952222 RepID=A0A9X2WLR3_9GAMM|nr:PepSY domain-containing protein [Shewanella holmiensis]MCT7941692.1 PepSY domain-containing protein [Shewanella holmiensis]